jgi:hypothetical protein
MAKKSNKKQTRSIPAPRSDAAVIPAAQATVGPAAASGGARSYDTDFNPDYSDTIRDLRRIGMLAGSFFALLIILAFIFHFVM